MTKEQQLKKNRSVNPKYTEPRGSKGRKKLGLPSIDFSGSRGYALAVGS